MPPKFHDASIHGHFLKKGPSCEVRKDEDPVASRGILCEAKPKSSASPCRRQMMKIASDSTLIIRLLKRLVAFVWHLGGLLLTVLKMARPFFLFVEFSRRSLTL